MKNMTLSFFTSFSILGVLILRAWKKNKLVEFAPRFAIDLVDLIEQNRRHNSVMLRILRLRID